MKTPPDVSPQGGRERDRQREKEGGGGIMLQREATSIAGF
jgi:hypothetical protein